MKLYCRQIPVEFQESPLMRDYLDCPIENFAIFGNRDCPDLMPEWFAPIYKAITSCELPYRLDCCETTDERREELTDWCPPTDEGRVYTDEEVEALAEAIAWCDTRCREEYWAKVLTIVTGLEWDYRRISGCCQGDWNTLYYVKKDFTLTEIRNLETEYFNEGSEWLCEESDEELAPLDINGCCAYAHGWNTDLIRDELARMFGFKPEDVVLYEVDSEKVNVYSYEAV